MRAEARLGRGRGGWGGGAGQGWGGGGGGGVGTNGRRRPCCLAARGGSTVEFGRWRHRPASCPRRSARFLRGNGSSGARHRVYGSQLIMRRPRRALAAARATGMGSSGRRRATRHSPRVSTHERAAVDPASEKFVLTADARQGHRIGRCAGGAHSGLSGQRNDSVTPPPTNKAP